MPRKAPARPTALDHVLGAAWVVIAAVLPVDEFYAVVSMLAAFVLWGIWAVRFLGGIMQHSVSAHWSWFVWPAIFFVAVVLHLIEEFPYFFLL